MQHDIRRRRVHVTPEFCRYIEGRLHIVPSRFGPREAGWDLSRLQLDPDRRRFEIKSWVHLHHVELMKSHGRSVARSIAKSKATGTSRATTHLVTGHS